MKTSLQLDDILFRKARREAEQTRRTLSEVISEWARLGSEQKKKDKKRPRRVKTLDLGGPAAVDLSSRRDWMDQLDE